MRRIEYLHVKKNRDDFGTWYEADGYGSTGNLNLFGRDGWELVSDYGNLMVFKRVRQEEKDYTEQFNSILDVLVKGLVAIDEHLAKLQAKEMMLTGLLQAVAEKVCPDSPFLLDMKAEMGMDGQAKGTARKVPAPKAVVENIVPAVCEGTTEETAPELTEVPVEPEGTPAEKMEASAASAEKSAESSVQETPEEAPEGTDPMDGLLDDFADKHVDLAMGGYQEKDKSLELFAILTGLGGLLPQQTPKTHCRYIIRSLYRYYERRGDHKIKQCYTDTLEKTAGYLSSPGIIEQLNGLMKNPVTIAEAVDIFYHVAMAQLEYERTEQAPFRVDQMGALIKAFTENMKNNPDLQSDPELMAKIDVYTSQIRQEFGLA